MMGEAWAQVELYRWQHGELPPQDSSAKTLDICEGLRGMARAFNSDGKDNPWPAPFNVNAVLNFVATEIERLKAERRMTNAQQPNDDERGKVIKSYQREAAEPEKHIIEDALKAERDAARSLLGQISKVLGCPEAEILAEVYLLHKNRRDA